MSLTAAAATPGQKERGLTRAVLVDDHQLLAQTLALALGLEGIDCVVPVLTDRDALIREVVSGPPALVLLDLGLGGVVGDGADLVAPFVAASCRVLVVSGTTDAEHLARALEAGAVGVIGKNAPFERLLEAALSVARGEHAFADTGRRAVLDEARRLRSERDLDLAPFRRLSSREEEVLRALATGQTVGCIAQGSFVSEATVRSQVRAILTKLGVSSQLEAVAAAHRHRWLPH